jgi:hypothetical protein
MIRLTNGQVDEVLVAIEKLSVNDQLAIALGALILAEAHLRRVAKTPMGDRMLVVVGNSIMRMEGAIRKTQTTND